MACLAIQLHLSFVCHVIIVHWLSSRKTQTLFVVIDVIVLGDLGQVTLDKDKMEEGKPLWYSTSLCCGEKLKFKCLNKSTFLSSFLVLLWLLQHEHMVTAGRWLRALVSYSGREKQTAGPTS